MIKRLQDFWERMRGDKGQLKATVRIEFYPNRTAYPSLVWHNSGAQEQDLVSLAIFLYARILYELAEINETRVAKELMSFLSQVVNLVIGDAGDPNRPRLPLGELSLPAQAPSEPPSRSYSADFFQHKDGQFRVSFQGSLGKEGVYLPSAFVVFLQYCLNRLPDEGLERLAHSLGRLHDYYKFRKDFWDTGAVSTAPVFALGTERLSPKVEDEEEETA
jgi:hypothetical protein